MQEGDEDERRRRAEHDPLLLVIEAHVGELAQKQRNERGARARPDHEEDGHEELSLVRLQVGKEPDEVGIELGLEALDK